MSLVLGDPHFKYFNYNSANFNLFSSKKETT